MDIRCVECAGWDEQCWPCNQFAHGERELEGQVWAVRFRSQRTDAYLAYLLKAPTDVAALQEGWKRLFSRKDNGRGWYLLDWRVVHTRSDLDVREVARVRDAMNGR